MHPFLVLLSLPAFLGGCSDTGFTTFNANPDAEITSHGDGQELLEGYTESFWGAVSDSDNSAEELSAAWYLDDEVACEAAAPLDLGLTLCDIQIPADATEVSLVVQDPDNAAGSARVSFTVISTDSPQVEILSPMADGVYYSDQKITFEAVVSDGEDAAADLVAEWESDLEGVLALDVEPDDDGTIAGAGYLAEGEHFLTLRAEDTTGKTGSDNVTVTVGSSNSAPDCEITAPESHSVDEEGTLVIFEAQVSDVDVPANWLTVTWSSDKDDELGQSTPDSGGAVAFPYDELSVNTHVVTLTVSDEVGADCSDFILYTVGTPPSITLDAPASGDIVDEGETVTFQATVADGEDTFTDLALSWNSDLDGEFSTQGSDSTGSVLFTESGLGVGTHTLTARVTDTDGLYAEALVLLVVNGLPTAPEIELSPDPATTEDTLSVTITTDATDADGDPVSYSHAWTVDGAPSSASTGATLSSADTTKGQTWTVEVTPNDGHSDGPAGSDSVTIDNTAPVLADVTLSPDPASEDDTLTCTPGTTTDPDGDSITHATAWSVDGSDPGVSETELTGDHFDRGSTVFCTVTPHDGEEAGASVDSNSVIIENTAPSIDSVAITPDPATISDTLTCSYTGYDDSDGDADASSLLWRVNGSIAGTGTTLSSGFVGGDTVVCVVTPDDGTDTGTAVSASLTIANTEPVLADVTLAPDPAVEGDTLTCTPGTTTDADGTSSFTYSYAWSVSGSDPGETGSTLSSDFFDRDQAVFCSVTPNDGTDDGTAVVSNTVTIGNTAPTIDAVSIDPDPAVAEDILTCSYTGYDDADGDSDASTYSWTVNGTEVGTDATLSGVFVHGDEVTCTVTAHDGTDAGNSDSASLTLDNTAPVLADVSLDPDPAYEADTLTCTPGTTTDADGTAGFGYETAWSVDGVDVGETASTLDGSVFDKGQEVVCTVTPNDGTDDGIAVDSNAVTISNTAPSIDSVSIAPAEPAYDDELTCSWAGYDDDDGDGDESTISWTIDGTEVGTDETLSGAFAAGETVTCTVTPHDGEDAGSAESAEVTIENTAPVVTDVTLSPSTVYTNDTITATVTTEDADGGSVSITYEWYVDGSLVGETGSSLDGVTYFDKDQEVHVVVTPNDGSDDGSSATSSSITVSNTAPGAPSLSIDPDEPVEGADDLLCQIDSDSSDDDEDAITYTITWEVDGVSYTDATTTTETGDTILYEVWAAGETWACTVTPNDGTDDGDSGFASVTVNTAPSAAEISISPNEPVEGANDLICVIDTESTDAEGDAITYTFEWTVNGSPYTDATTTTETGDTVPAADTTAGEQWTCTVTPNDGEEDGNNASDTVTIGSESFDQLTCGDFHCCVLYASGTLGCWGIDDGTSGSDYGQVRNTPPGSDYTALTGGPGWNCALDSSGGIDCWGYSGPSSSAPSGTGYTAVGGGTFHACAVDSSGSLECWGGDSSNQVSDAPTGTGFSSLTGGQGHGCALVTGGYVECWGLDDGTGADYGQVTDTPSGSGYKAVSASERSVCAITSSGGIACWGDDRYFIVSDAPTGGGYTSLGVASSATICAIQSGRVDCWGRDNKSQVSDAPTGSGYTAVSAGALHGCAITSGSVDCWGDDDTYGQVSDAP
jgi:hypothetical protein